MVGYSDILKPVLAGEGLPPLENQFLEQQRPPRAFDLQSDHAGLGGDLLCLDHPGATYYWGYPVAPGPRASNWPARPRVFTSPACLFLRPDASFAPVLSPDRLVSHMAL